LFRMLIGTVYIKRRGWAYLEVDHLGAYLKQQDPSFEEKLVTWGNNQLLPQWYNPKATIRRGILVDMKCRVMLPVEVLDKPNQLLTMAVHGTGITCMLLDRPDDALLVAKKVGMANLPPYILAQTIHSGSVYVGGEAPSPNERFLPALRMV
ncbi:hypothetical protein M422DRAFT_187900, partial [Sphaerobolus stellatus SS14]